MTARYATPDNKPKANPEKGALLEVHQTTFKFTGDPAATIDPCSIIDRASRTGKQYLDKLELELSKSDSINHVHNKFL